jgi:hypothetical protein
VVIGEATDEMACLRRGLIDAGKLHVLVSDRDFVKVVCRRRSS